MKKSLSYLGLLLAFGSTTISEAGDADIFIDNAVLGKVKLSGINLYDIFLSRIK